MIQFGKIDPHLFAKKTQRDLLRVITGGASGMHVRSMRGASRRLGATYFVRNDKQCVRRYVKPRQPDSHDQVQHRAWFARAEKQWTPIFLQHAESWAAYAEQHRKVLGYRDFRMNNGRHLMREVQLTRLQMGLELGEAAPVRPPMRSRLELFQEPAQDDSTFRFQVMHNIPDPTGMSLLVEITPATVRPTRKPHPNSYRPIRGKNAASYLPLQASGATYEVTGARYAVADGERYGMRLRIIDTEYISGAPAARDFIRQIRINPDEPDENEVGSAIDICQCESECECGWRFAEGIRSETPLPRFAPVKETICFLQEETEQTEITECCAKVMSDCVPHSLAPEVERGFRSSDEMPRRCGIPGCGLLFLHIVKGAKISDCREVTCTRDLTVRLGRNA